MKVLIERYPSEEKQTLGNLYVLDKLDSIQFKCVTLELPWKKNKRRVSCIPLGEYRVIKHTSPKFGKCFWIRDVEGRSEILIHKGNFYTDILGCILVGIDFIDIDNNGILDVTSSKDTMDELLKILPDGFKLEIKESSTGVVI